MARGSGRITDHFTPVGCVLAICLLTDVQLRELAGALGLLEDGDATAPQLATATAERLAVPRGACLKRRLGVRTWDALLAECAAIAEEE